MLKVWSGVNRSWSSETETGIGQGYTLFSKLQNMPVARFGIDVLTLGLYLAFNSKHYAQLLGLNIISYLFNHKIKDN